MLLPVENASDARTNPNAGFDHHVISSASRLRWTIPSAIAPSVSTTKSRSDTASSEFARHALEVELARGRLAVERIAGPGQGARAERADVGATAGVGQAAAVALHHLDVRQQVMGEQDGLGGLDVGRPRQDGVALALGQFDERPLEDEVRRIEAIDRPARPQPQVRGDLVVARPAGVELAGDRPDPGRQRGLEVHVDVLEGRIPVDAAGGDVLGQRGQATDELVDLVPGQEPGPAQPAHVGDRGREVVGGESGIHLDRPGEIGDALVVLFAEAAAPESHAASVWLSVHGTRRRDRRAAGRLSAMRDGTAAMVMLQATGLGRRFGDLWAVRGMDLSVARGEVLGLLGPNGAGKTTTVRHADRAHRADRGHGRRSKASTSASSPTTVRARVGILTETPGLYDKLSATRQPRLLRPALRPGRRDARRAASSATCACSRCGTGATTSPARSARA